MIKSLTLIIQHIANLRIVFRKRICSILYHFWCSTPSLFEIFMLDTVTVSDIFYFRYLIDSVTEFHNNPDTDVSYINVKNQAYLWISRVISQAIIHFRQHMLYKNKPH